jgi:hypothetical protein
MSDTGRGREAVDRLLARSRDSVQDVYDARIRRRLPRTLGVYNGVVTRRYYLLDLSASGNEPGYKERLVDAVRRAVEPGDTVVEVGAGFGVCTTWAARAAGDEGRVISLEANAEQTDVVREALELTGQVTGEALSERVEVRHAIVGSELKTYGPMAGAARVDPSELPACDVLVMDCEGAELGVLEGTSIGPRSVVVETHPAFGAPTSDVLEVLSSMGYASEARRVTTKPEGSKDVLTATLESSG